MLNYISINPEIRIPKGNFSFILDTIGNEKLYYNCLSAEKKLFTSPPDSIKDMRAAFEVLSVDAVVFSENPKATAHERELKCIELEKSINENNKKGGTHLSKKQLLINLINQESNIDDSIVTQLSKISCLNIKGTNLTANLKNKKLTFINSVLHFYSLSSEETHNNEGDLQTAVGLIRALIIFICFFYKIGLRGINFDKIPYGDYFPITPNLYKKMGFITTKNAHIYIKESKTGISYYLLREVKDRDSTIIDFLWNKTPTTPNNILATYGTIGIKSYEKIIYNIPQRPFALTEEYVNGLSSQQREAIVLGIMYAIKSIHDTVSYVALRGLFPGGIYVCDIDGTLKPFLFDFSFSKDWNSQSTVYGDIISAVQESERRRFIAPEIITESFTSKEDLQKSDIYSLGKIVDFIFADNCENEYRKKIDSFVKILTEADYAKRPDINSAISLFNEIIGRKTISICTMKGARDVQQDVFYCNRTGIVYGDEYRKTVDVSLPLIAGVFDGIAGGVCGNEISLFAAQTAKRFVDENSILLLNKDVFINKLTKTLCDECETYCAERAYRKSGTTLALAVITKRHIYTSNIGDSRIYVFKHNELRKLTKEHRSVSPGGQNYLYQYLGMSQEFEIEPCYKKAHIESGNYVLITTDGLTDKISEDELSNIFRENSTAESAAEKLISEATKKGISDNISFAVFRFA